MEMQSSMQNVFPREQIILSQLPTQPLSYEPAINQDFVERLLGRRNRRDLPRTTRKRLTIQHNRLQELISSQVTWKEFSIARIDKTGVTLADGTYFKSQKMARALQGAIKVVCFIATIGRQIDNEIENLINGGALAHGYIADALASGAVESLADRFHNDIAKEIARQDHSVGLRFSPGYCDWPVTEQQKLFPLLDNDAVGVTLGDTSLMVPRKTISALFGIFEGKNTPRKNSTHNPCRQCGKKDCIARRVEAVPPLH